jgi:hypothetical protein
MLESAILQNQQQQWPPLWPDVKSSKVVSTGRATTDNAYLWSWFTVRKHKVYSALKWLVQNHVTIHEQMMSAWEFAFVAVELFYSIARDWEPSAEDASRDGFGMTHECAWCDDTAGDLPFTSSGIVHMNNIAEIIDCTTLTRPACSTQERYYYHAVTGSKILNQYNCTKYFTSVFQGLFL